MQYGAALLLVQLVVGCSDGKAPENIVAGANNAAAPVNEATPAADTKLVVAYGDSLFAGYGLESGEGFAPVLEKALIARGVKARVMNGAVSGETTGDGRERLAFTLDGLPRKPNLVILGLGGNDMLRGLDPKATRANLDAILAELKRRDIATMMTGMLASPNMGPDYASAFNSIYPDLAKAYGVKLYPFFLDGVIGHADLQLPDGIHPNAKGIDIVVAKVAPVVVGELDD